MLFELGGSNPPPRAVLFEKRIPLNENGSSVERSIVSALSALELPIVLNKRDMLLHLRALRAFRVLVFYLVLRHG